MKTETVLKRSCNAALIFLLTAVVCSAADVKQSAYPTKISPVAGDKALIIDSADGNKTKNVTLGSLPLSTATNTALNLKETKAVIQASAPADTTVDWYDTDQEPGVLILKRHNGTTWVRVGSHGVQYAPSCAGITAGMCVDTDDGKLYYHNNNEVVEVGSGSVDLSAYLSKTNTTAFTPSGDYHPATKKYVDDAVTAGGGYTDEQAQDAVGGMFSGNTETGIIVTYDDAIGKVNFVVATQSDVNFTSTLNIKLAGIATGAEVNVNADWNSSSGDSQILNKPTIPTVSDTAYGSGWNGDTGAASKNAIYDKIETLSGSSLPAWLPSTGPTDSRQILQATGGCSNATYSTQATCEAASATWTTPAYANTSIISGLINDSGTADDDLWSAAKITTELSGKQVDLSPPDQAEAEAGTSTIERVWTAQRVAQAIAALAPSVGGGGGNVILQQSFVSASTLVADTGAKNKLASGVNWATADVGCDASDTLIISVKSSSTVNGTYTQIGTITLSANSSASGVDISSWVDSTSGHWIRIDLSGTPAAAKDCIIAIGGTEL